MLRPVLITAPDSPIVNLGDLKAWCRADYADDDSLLTALEVAAVSRMDGWSGILGRCLLTQTWRVDRAGWPSDRAQELPFPDVGSVTVKYFDTDNVEQVVSSSNYELLEGVSGGFIRFLPTFDSPAINSDRSDAVRIEVTAGYGDASAVPAPLVTAIKMLVAHWYENREAVVVGSASTEVPMTVAALIAPYRRSLL
ncbi:MAG: head-tail connector protein [Pseudomonadota bacterium]